MYLPIQIFNNSKKKNKTLDVFIIINGNGFVNNSCDMTHSDTQ